MEIARTTIDGQVYILRPMMPEQVLLHCSKLMALVGGPALKAAADTKAEKNGGFSGVVGVVGCIVGEAFKQMAHPEVKSVFDALFATAVVVKGEAELELNVAWKTHFAGKPGAMVHFLKFALVAQFGDFFRAMQDSILGGLQEQLASLGLGEKSKAAGSPTT